MHKKKIIIFIIKEIQINESGVTSKCEKEKTVIELDIIREKIKQKKSH